VATKDDATDASDAADASDASDRSSDDDGDHPRRKKRQKITACSVVSGNIAREAGAILAANGRGGHAPRAAWDHRSAPERLDAIRRRFELDRAELDMLHRTGVVVPARLAQPSYAYGYHEIFQSQLPVYITADSLFHAIFASREAIDALALADLATRSGAAAGIATVEAAWSALAGRREDVSIAQLGELRKAAGITDLRGPQAFAALKRAIGDRFQRAESVG